jgi:choline kinase
VEFSTEEEGQTVELSVEEQKELHLQQKRVRTMQWAGEHSYLAMTKYTIIKIQKKLSHILWLYVGSFKLERSEGSDSSCTDRSQR